MVIYWDVTKTGSSKHKSGINRVSACLFASLSTMPGLSVVPVIWSRRKKNFVDAVKGKELIGCGHPSDFFLSCEVFCEAERVGFEGWLSGFKGKRCLVFHDAIPLQFPEFTWPHSVNRHPHYMKMLLGFDAVFAVSKTSQAVLESYLQWLNPATSVLCGCIQLGADFDHSARCKSSIEGKARRLIVSGILEPRKNQALLLDAMEVLGREVAPFSIHFVGRVNPHFGQPIVKRIRAMKRAGFSIFHESSLSDKGLRDLYAQSLFSVFPSQAEGCGLPVLESLWQGLPVLSSDIPALLEQAEGGGITYFKNNDLDSLVHGLRSLLLAESTMLKDLYAQIESRHLKRWEESARDLVALLQGL